MERLEEGLLDGGRDREDGTDGGNTREEGLNEDDQHRDQQRPPNIQHLGICNGCQMKPIVGTRYKCTVCRYYLCSACQSIGLHKEHHLSIQHPIWEPKDFKKRECNTFIEDSSRDGRCRCGRPRDKHPPDIKTDEDTEWTTELHSSELPTDAFGWLMFSGEKRVRRFLRLSSDTKPSLVYDLMTRSFRDDRGWEMEPPALVVSVVGGEGSAEVKPWVQEAIRQGLAKAKATGTWILTEGFDGGIGRCVGEAVRDINKDLDWWDRRVRAVAITPWGVVHNRQHLVNPESVNAKYSVENKTSDSCCLEKNHEVFLLVDDGSEGRGGGEKNFSIKLEEHIPTQHIRESSSITIPVLCMLISGELSILERVDLSLKNGTPWLVLAGSGGVADLLSDILENLESHASAGDEVDRVTALFKEHIPPEAQTDQLVKQVQSIYENRKLITFYHEEKKKPEDFDTAMIKALMPASKHHASGNTFPGFPYSKELILAMRWNKVDFASSQLFNDEINCVDETLKDCMTFALLNDKTQFVRLFFEKKFNFQIYRLTYGLLEKLYSRVDKDTLLYKLLLEHLKGRLGASWEPERSDPLKEISLLEVSGILEKFMGEEKKPFYFNSGKKALENAILTHLFIWAVLRNHSDWAVIFWETAEEPVLNALSACKMLKEMSKLETQTDTKLSMEKLAQKFEDRAHGMLGSCYQSNESNSFELLNRKSPVWNKNCFQMGIAVESHSFFKHNGLESTLSQVWWGDMEKDTTVWKVLLTLLCFPLCFTNLISFRWHQFWSAPVTSFVGNALMHFPFLFLFAYVLLMDFKPTPPRGPSISEYVLYFWVFTFLCEEIYEAFFMHDMSFRQRMKLYMKDIWNMYDCTSIILFIIGLISRMFEWSYEFGRCVLCIDYMVFTLCLIHIFTVDKQMGPIIIIVGKMMKDVFSCILLLGVWIVAYGVANQGLKYHYDSDPYRIFLQVFYKPYLHIFGEEIDVGLKWDKANNCTSNETEIWGGAKPCRNEYWLSKSLVIILLVVFLLVTIILLINLLIAMLTNTFEQVHENSGHHWKFQQYKLIVEYQSRPVLAPPFIIINHLYLLFSYCTTTIMELPDGFSEEAQRKVRELKDWETKQKQNFLTAQSETERSSDSERIKQISDKVERMENQLKQLTEQFTAQRTEIKALETKMEKCISDALGQILDRLNKPPST